MYNHSLTLFVIAVAAEVLNVTVKVTGINRSLEELKHHMIIHKLFQNIYPMS